MVRCVEPRGAWGDAVVKFEMESQMSRRSKKSVYIYFCWWYVLPSSPPPLAPLSDHFPPRARSRAGAASYDATLQQQFVALTDLLEDAHPQVRAVAGKVTGDLPAYFYIYSS